MNAKSQKAKTKKKTATSSDKPKRAKKPTTTDEYYFDEEEADRIIDFFHKYIVHIEAEWVGKPFILQPWQIDLLRELFGWKRVKDGTRKYRTLYLEIPRKNGKSTLAAGIALYMLFCDAEARAQIVSAAADKEQAKIVFKMAKDIIAVSPKLAKRCKVYRDSIYFPTTKSSYWALSADAVTKHGLNAHGIIFDELHAQKKRELYDVLHTSRLARRQPLEVLITTAGFDRESICWEMHEKAKNVINGIDPDPTFLAKIFGIDESDYDKWDDPKVWAKCNPNLGISIKLDGLQEECDKAKASPSYENTFKNLYLNMWTDVKTVFIPLYIFRRTKRKYGEKDLLGMQCYGGLDLSSRVDLTAFGLVFPFPNGTYKTLRWLWMPENRVREKEKKDNVPYKSWIKRGFITTTPGDIIDYDFIKATIIQVSSMFEIRELAYDPWGATQIAIQLGDEGLNMVECRQGYKTMSEPMKEYEAQIIANKLWYPGDPVSDWMISNLMAVRDPAGNIKPDKTKINHKIDGPVAHIMALGRAIANNEQDFNEHYTQSGGIFG